ncbi:MAG: hypothetical protein JW751_08680 [Polyangiaceae bacterium]|nr:hypothetical protein [Polyangiaceae bacterium]
MTLADSCTIDQLVELSRSLWQETYGAGEAVSADAKWMRLSGAAYAAWTERYLRECDQSVPGLREQILDRLATHDPKTGWNAWIKADNGASARVSIRLHVFSAPRLVNAYFRMAEPDPDRQHFIWRNVRRQHGFHQSAETVRAFHTLAGEINRILAAHRPPSRRVAFKSGVFDPLVERLRADEVLAPNANGYVDLFIECCLGVAYLEPRWRRGEVMINPPQFDPEYLMSRLFGVPSRMKGLDDVFGGGGIAMPDIYPGDKGKPPRGRAIVIRGRFGTGKTYLAVGLSADVARKEGLAWAIPLEQSVDDWRCYLESSGALANTNSVTIAATAGDVAKLLDSTASDTPRPTGRTGSLVLLRTARSNDLLEVLDRLKDYASLVGAPPQESDGEVRPSGNSPSLRLLVIDPLTAVAGLDGVTGADARAHVMEAIDTIKENGFNLVIVAEDGVGSERGANTESTPLPFLDNIADTVIRLSEEMEHGYSTRYLEVLKSRMQRELRGRHAISIRSGQGIVISPSAAAVSSRVRDRRLLKSDPQDFGWPLLDKDVLSGSAFIRGDVVVLRGPAGSLRTQVGFLFLLGAAASKKSTLQGGALLLPVRSDPILARRGLEAAYLGIPDRSPAMTPRQVDILDLPGGYVQPGRILQEVEDAFTRAQVRGQVIERVMLDDIAHWETTCPFIRDDPAFSDALIDLIRRNNATVLAVCAPEAPSAALQRAVAEQASLLLDFQKVEHRGSHHVIVRVAKSRSMQHRSDSFEVALSPTGELRLSPSLLRVGPSGEVRTLTMRLQLHADNARQEEYNLSVRDALRPVLSPSVKVNSNDRTPVPRALALGALSVIDELEVLQIDEFHLPELRPAEGDRRPALHRFPTGAWWDGWDEIDDTLRQRVRDAEGFFAVPYYNNIGLLVHDEKSFNDEVVLDSWRNLADECAKWEKENRDPKSVFFALPLATAEDYNCVFLEMAVAEGLDLPARTSDSFATWLAQSAALDVCEMFWRLLRRSHAMEVRRKNGRAAVADCSASAPLVARQWYTTVGDFLAGLPTGARDRYRVRALPKSISCRGEWYLCVPAHSASPDLGLEILRLLTGREAELERFRRGTGLPVRGRFYDASVPLQVPLLGAGRRARTPVPVTIPVSGVVVRDLEKLFSKAIRRSWIEGYAAFSPSLAFYLRRMLEVFPPGPDEPTDQQVRAGMSAILGELLHHVAFVVEPRRRQRERKAQ